MTDGADRAVTVQWYLKEEQPFAAATWQMMLGAASSIMAIFGVSQSYLPCYIVLNSAVCILPRPLYFGSPRVAMDDAHGRHNQFHSLHHHLVLPP